MFVVPLRQQDLALWNVKCVSRWLALLLFGWCVGWVGLFRTITPPPSLLCSSSPWSTEAVMENLTPKSEFPPWPSPPPKGEWVSRPPGPCKKTSDRNIPKHASGNVPQFTFRKAWSCQRRGTTQDQLGHTKSKKEKNTSLLRRAGITFLQILCCCPICDCALTFTIFFLVLMPILRLFKMGWSFGGYKMQHNRTQKAQKNRFCVCGLLYVSLHLQKNQGL